MPDSVAPTGITWYPGGRTATRIARITTANIAALAELTGGSVFDDDGTPTLSVAARLPGYPAPLWSTSQGYPVGSCAAPGGFVFDLDERGWGAVSDSPGAHLWFADADYYVQAVAAWNAEPVQDPATSIEQQVASLVARLTPPAGADAERFRRTLTSELTRSVTSGEVDKATLATNLGLAEPEPPASAPPQPEQVPTAAPARSVWDLDISSYRGISLNADHWYGTMRADTRDADAEVQHVLTRASARALNRKEHEDSRIYAPGMFSNRFNSREQVIDAAKAIFTHIAGPDSVLLHDAARDGVAVLVAPEQVRSALDMPPTGRSHLRAILTGLGFPPIPRTWSSTNPQTHFDCAVTYGPDGRITGVLDTEDKDYDLAFTDWDDGPEHDDEAEAPA